MRSVERPEGRIIVILFSTVILVAGMIMLYKIVERKQLIDGRNNFKDLELTSTENLVTTISSVGRNSPFIIMFFDPDCNYCHLETEALLSHIDDFDGIIIYMITTNKLEVLAEFELEYSLVDYPGIITGRIDEEIFSAKYGLRTIPSIMIYNATGNLIYSNAGYTPVDEILKILGAHTQTTPSRL